MPSGGLSLYTAHLLEARPVRLGGPDRLMAEAGPFGSRERTMGMMEKELMHVGGTSPTEPNFSSFVGFAARLDGAERDGVLSDGQSRRGDQR
jgi:hypothetical protein